MNHAMGVAGITAGAFLGEFAFKMFEHVCGGKLHHKVDHVIELAARRFVDGELPHNGHLERALYTALGQAARVLAYHLHDPKRGPMRDLLQNFSTWPNFLQRFAELAQNNIVAVNPRDKWLEKLIDESKEPKNYEHDFSLKLVLEENQITRLLRGKSDVEFRTHIHLNFLAWVEKHVPNNGYRPADFAERVEQGWPVGGHEGKAMAFYDVFCLFFREALKEETEVFRAFSVNVLTGLKKDVEEIKAVLPDAKTLQEFTETLRSFEEKEFDANYSQFKVWTHKQNDKLYGYLRTEFAGVHEHLKVQDSTLEAIEDTTATHREESQTAFSGLQRYGKWVAAGVLLLVVVVGAFWWQNNEQYRDLRERLKEVQKRDARGSKLIAEFRSRLEAPNFSAQKVEPDQRVATVLADIARDSRTTVDELHQRILQAAVGARERIELAGRLRPASKSEATRLKQVERDGFKDLASAVMAEHQHVRALDYYQHALALTSKVDEAQEWARLQNSLGVCHWGLGIRGEGAAANEHLRNAVAAYREALKVWTREQFPQAWAAIQSNLSTALSDQAGRSEGAQAARLLDEAVAAYKEALTIWTISVFPNYHGIASQSLARVEEALRKLKQ